VSVKADGSFKIVGSRSAITAALGVLHGCLPCQFGEKCRDVFCSMNHLLSLQVSGASNRAFVSSSGNLDAIAKQTGALLAWDPQLDSVRICGKQKEVTQAKAHLKRLELCRFSERCCNDACPHWHSIKCDLSYPPVCSLPESAVNRMRAAAAQRFDNIEMTWCSQGAYVAGLRNDVMKARTSLVACRYNSDCTNRACKFLHVKELPNFEKVNLGRVIGTGGRRIKEIEVDTKALVHLIQQESAGSYKFVLTGTQDEVFQAEKQLRESMFRATNCHFGTACTNRACKFGHPKGRFSLFR